MQVESTKAVTGELILSQNDQFLSKQQVQIEPGNNTFTLRHASTGEGLLKYQVQLDITGDALLENNQLTSVTMVESAPRIIGCTVVINYSHLSRHYIDQDVVKTDEISALELPFDLSNYLGYDAIIFDNVPGSRLVKLKWRLLNKPLKTLVLGL